MQPLLFAALSFCRRRLLGPNPPCSSPAKAALIQTDGATALHHHLTPPAGNIPSFPQAHHLDARPGRPTLRPEPDARQHPNRIRAGASKRRKHVPNRPHAPQRSRGRQAPGRGRTRGRTRGGGSIRTDSRHPLHPYIRSMPSLPEEDGSPAMGHLLRTPAIPLFPLRPHLLGPNRDAPGRIEATGRLDGLHPRVP
jgi:hypothetical protein